MSHVSFTKMVNRICLFFFFFGPKDDLTVDGEKKKNRRRWINWSIKGAVHSNINFQSLSAHWGWRDNDWILNLCQWWSFLLCETFLGLHSRAGSLGTCFKTWNGATQFAWRDAKLVLKDVTYTPFLKPTSSLSAMLKALACTPSEAFAHVNQINLGSQVLPESTKSAWRDVRSNSYVSFLSSGFRRKLCRCEDPLTPGMHFLKSELIL